MMRGIRTDLAMESIGKDSAHLEGVRVSTHRTGRITHTRIRIESSRAAELLGREKGEYVTLECAELSQPDARSREALARMVALDIRRMLPKEGEVLVVGLGNRNVTADALGTRVVERMLVTRHLHQTMAEELAGRLRGVSAIAPGVLGLTQETLGVKVIAVGVPMVVYASTIARDAMSRLIASAGACAPGEEEAADELLRKSTQDFLGSMVVTPREIDELVLNVASLLADGLNRALQPALAAEDLHHYLHI